MRRSLFPPAAALAPLALLCLTAALASPNRYGYAERVEKHLLPAVSTGPLDPAWSPDGQWLAFSMRGDIWKVPAGGGEAVALTEGPAYHFEPAWSPDGSRLALSFDAGDGNLDLGLVSADGGTVQRLTTHRDVDIQPTWSRDGDSLYFVSGRGSGFGIYRHELASGREERVTTGLQPAVSPDGRQLAYVGRVAGRMGTGGIWIMDLPDGEPRLVHYEETAYRMKPAWTPDGQAFLFVSDDTGTNDLAIVAARGGNKIPLTPGPWHEFAPAPSPDGSRFAFVSNRGGPTTLYTVAAGGGPFSSWNAVEISARRARAPTGRVRVRVLGADGQPTPARIHLLASDGRAYAPNGGFHRVISATETHYFHAEGEFEVEVPAGETAIEAVKGYEYRPVSVTVDVPAGSVQQAELRLEHLLDMRERGWYSGDTHVHDLHQGRYGLTHETFFLQLAAEDLGVSNALIHMDGTRLMGRWDDLTGEPHPLSTPDHLLQYAQEYRGSLGHVALLGIRRYVLPFTGGVGATAYAQPGLDLDYIDGAREQGGIAGFVHPFNSRVRQPSGAARSLIPLNAALGRGDFYDVAAVPSNELASTEFYYRLLNCGFRIAATGGTDNFSDVWRDPPPGASRTYVRLEGPLTVENWLAGVKAQRTFATTGPLLFLEVEGRQPGDEIQLPANAPAALRVRAEALSIAPFERLEIVVNGEIARTVPATDPLRAEFDSAVSVPEGGWVAARVIGPSTRYVTDHHAFAHTSPVYVVRGGEQWVSAADAAFLAAAVRALWSNAQNSRWRTPAERDRFRAAVEEAVAVYERLAAGS